ncbi:MAG TPA: DUF6755 family protein [Acidimicrobiia bacterium]|nr:DUF6755 family protein [Acidimicrobiia bacterium]
MSLPGRRRKVTNAILVYVLLILSLQIFLVIVAAEGFLEGDAALAWAATSISAVLALVALLFHRFLR